MAGTTVVPGEKTFIEAVHSSTTVIPGENILIDNSIGKTSVSRHLIFLKETSFAL